MYHPNPFASLDEASDPGANAHCPARFFNALNAASGSWVQAMAAHHSQTPAIGADYQRRVMARLPMPMMSAVSTSSPPPGTRYADLAPVSRAYGDFAAQSATLPARLAGR